MVIWGHGGGLLADVLGELSPGNPPVLLLHMWHNTTGLSAPREGTPEASVHRPK